MTAFRSSNGGPPPPVWHRRESADACPLNGCIHIAAIAESALSPALKSGLSGRYSVPTDSWSYHSGGQRAKAGIQLTWHCQHDNVGEPSREDENAVRAPCDAREQALARREARLCSCQVSFGTQASVQTSLPDALRAGHGYTANAWNKSNPRSPPGLPTRWARASFLSLFAVLTTMPPPPAGTPQQQATDE